MTESAIARPRFEGQMFLYDQPELLTKADHDGLGLAPAERPYEFVRAIKAVPLVTVEFASAQKDYPIIFTEGDVPQPLAMIGIIDDANLFVDEDGNWERRHYIPTYIRCHPIAFAAGPNDQLAVVIDRSARSVTANPELPFFDGDKLSAKMQERVEFCGRFDAERKRTVDICRKLKELDLFGGQQITQRPTEEGGESRVIGTYLAVDLEKVAKLDAGTIAELYQDGTLAALYAHAFSLENWNRLLDRREERLASAANE